MDIIGGPIILAAIILLIPLSYIVLYGYKTRPITQKINREYKGLCFGFLLLILGIFPYAAVGKIPRGTIDSRHALLIGIPMSIIFIFLMRISIRVKMLTEKGSILLFIPTIILFAATDLNNYIKWQFRWIKDRSVMETLAETPNAQKYSIFYIKNKTFSQNEKDYYEYNFYEWSTMFRMIWHEEKWIGFQKLNMNRIDILQYKKYFTHRYNLSQFNPYGSSAELFITYSDPNFNVNTWTEAREVKNYYYYKFLKKNKLKDYLKNLVKLQIRQIPI